MGWYTWRCKAKVRHGGTHDGIYAIYCYKIISFWWQIIGHHISCWTEILKNLTNEQKSKFSIVLPQKQIAFSFLNCTFKSIFFKIVSKISKHLFGWVVRREKRGDDVNGEIIGCALKGIIHQKWKKKKRNSVMISSPSCLFWYKKLKQNADELQLIVFTWRHTLIWTSTWRTKPSFAPLTDSYFYADCIK